MMRLDAVYEIINQAKASELRYQYYANALKMQLGSLHRVIRLESDHPTDALISFVIDYIELVPKMLECIEQSAEEADQENLFAPFLKLSTQYFVQPSILVLQHSGVDGLLVRAYQCHRLIEELYENNHKLRSASICSLEAAQANLLAHHLIGEPFSNELDQAVYLTLRQIVSLTEYYHMDLDRYLKCSTSKRWEELNEAWLHLLPNHGIQMNFMLRLH